MEGTAEKKMFLSTAKQRTAWWGRGRVHTDSQSVSWHQNTFGGSSGSWTEEFCLPATLTPVVLLYFVAFGEWFLTLSNRSEDMSTLEVKKLLLIMKLLKVASLGLPWYYLMKTLTWSIDSGSKTALQNGWRGPTSWFHPVTAPGVPNAAGTHGICWQLTGTS